MQEALQLHRISEKNIWLFLVTSHLWKLPEISYYSAYVVCKYFLWGNV